MRLDLKGVIYNVRSSDSPLASCRTAPGGTLFSLAAPAW